MHHPDFLNRKVYLTTDRYLEKGLGEYAVGYVVESLGGDRYSINFSEMTNAPGTSIVATPDDFLLYEMYKGVRMTTNRFLNEGVPEGTVGCVIEAYGADMFLIDFSDDEGITYADIYAVRGDFEVVGD